MFCHVAPDYLFKALDFKCIARLIRFVLWIFVCFWVSFFFILFTLTCELCALFLEFLNYRTDSLNCFFDYVNVIDQVSFALSLHPQSGTLACSLYSLYCNMLQLILCTSMSYAAKNNLSYKYFVAK